MLIFSGNSKLLPQKKIDFSRNWKVSNGLFLVRVRGDSIEVDCVSQIFELPLVKVAILGVDFQFCTPGTIEQ